MTETLIQSTTTRPYTHRVTLRCGPGSEKDILPVFTSVDQAIQEITGLDSSAIQLLIVPTSPISSTAGITVGIVFYVDAEQEERARAPAVELFEKLNQDSRATKLGFGTIVMLVASS